MADDISNSLKLAIINHDHISFIRLLEGGNLEEIKRYRYDNGESLLHIAVGANNEEVIKELIKLNFIINCQDNYGCTPLYYACSSNLVSIINLLLDIGADSTIPNNILEFNCLDIAEEIDIRLLEETRLNEVHNAILEARKTSTYIDSLYIMMYLWNKLYLQKLKDSEINLEEYKYLPDFVSDISINDIENKCKNLELKLLDVRTNIIQACLNCNCLENLKSCSKCKHVKLCSQKCSEFIWNWHKKFCISLEMKNENLSSHSKVYLKFLKERKLV